MVILENIDIDIVKAILQNIDIDKISNRFKFGISNRAIRGSNKVKFIKTTLNLSQPTLEVANGNGSNIAYFYNYCDNVGCFYMY